MAHLPSAMSVDLNELLTFSLADTLPQGGVFGSLMGTPIINLPQTGKRQTISILE